MAEPFSILLDQNVSRPVTVWLRRQRPGWRVAHVVEVGLEHQSDPAIFRWAQAHGYVILTWDEDFADQRVYPLAQHHGIVRLRVHPTTDEATQDALNRLFAAVRETEFAGALIVVDNYRIRVRRQPG